MNLVSMEFWRESLALAKPFVTALRRVESVEFVRLSLKSERGDEVFGEAPATLAITGEDLPKIEASLALMKPRLLGKTPQEALTLLHDAPIGSSAKAALDMALFSLLATQKDLSMADFLHIADTRSIECDITISLGSTEQMLYDAKAAFTRGVKQLKIKLGSDIVHAIETTNLLSQKLPSATLLIDANQAWSVEATFKYLQETQNAPKALIEQPVNAADLEGLKCITQQSQTPILADEAAFSLEEVKHIIESKSAHMINIKLMKCGGVSKAVEILEYARTMGVKCMLGSMLEGPISINAALYLAFAYRDVIAFVDLDSPLLYAKMPSGLHFSYSAASISFKDAFLPRDRAKDSL